MCKHWIEKAYCDVCEPRKSITPGGPVDRQALAAAILLALESNPDGFTLNARGIPVSRGYAVARPNTAAAALHADSILEWIDIFERSLSRGACVGGWADSGSFWLEIADVFGSKITADKVALSRRQRAYFDLGAVVEIETAFRDSTAAADFGISAPSLEVLSAIA